MALSRSTWGVVGGSFTRNVRIAFGHGCDCTGCVRCQCCCHCHSDSGIGACAALHIDVLPVRADHGAAPGAEPTLTSLINLAITPQNLRLGAVRRCSQFLSVSRLTPSCAASVFWVRACLTRCDRRLWESSFRFPARGCESPLMALITRWQKGFRTDPFRQPVYWQRREDTGSHDTID